MEAAQTWAHEVDHETYKFWFPVQRASGRRWLRGGYHERVHRTQRA